MTIKISRCGACVHARDMIDGWLPTCDAFPNGIDFEICDKPGRDCANGLKFEPKPELKEKDYERLFKRWWD